MKNKVFFEKINNKKIFCYFSEGNSNKNKLVIMSHGFRGNSTGPTRTFVDFSRILVKSGYSVLRFDQPNCGNSDGDFLDVSFNEWIYTIVYLADKYLNLKYKIALLGQSMGATATVAAVNNKKLKNKIPAIILWVPDPKSYIDELKDIVYEEEGERYNGRFWIEAKESNFFNSLENYKGKIHLVYGEFDKYVDKREKVKVIETVKKMKQEFMVLKGENHSRWRFNSAQLVYKKELEFLNKIF